MGPHSHSGSMAPSGMLNHWSPVSGSIGSLARWTPHPTGDTQGQVASPQPTRPTHCMAPVRTRMPPGRLIVRELAMRLSTTSTRSTWDQLRRRQEPYCPSISTPCGEKRDNSARDHPPVLAEEDADGRRSHGSGEQQTDEPAVREEGTDHQGRWEGQHEREEKWGREREQRSPSHSELIHKSNVRHSQDIRQCWTAVVETPETGPGNASEAYIAQVSQAVLCLRPVTF